MSEKKLNNNFTKTLLQSYIITQCERRLFHELAKNKPNLWLKPYRKTKKSKRIPRTLEYLQKLGKDYEQLVYSQLKKLSNAYYREVDELVDRSYMTPSKMLELSKKLVKNNNDNLILLEFEFFIPEMFFRRLFKKKTDNYQIPVEYGKQRPDILILGNKINDELEQVFELETSGNFVELNRSSLTSRFGISIFDIKKTQSERVSKKHFVEIFYYMWTLAYFLKANNLHDKFYVRANYNGILPEATKEDLNQLTDFAKLLESDVLTQINWEESKRIFRKITKKIKQLWSTSPQPIENIPLHIHQGCGYCQYIEDCKETLGWMEYGTAKDWSLELIPFTSTSIAKQLRSEYGFITVGDVSDNFDSIRIGTIPKPIYPELPMLKLKTQALMEKKFVYAKTGKNQTFSYMIPRYSPMALSFGVEYDSNNEKVFSIGLYLKIFVFRELNYHRAFNKWWGVWKNAIDKDMTAETILSELNEFLPREITLETVNKFKEILSSLNDAKISLQGEKTETGTEFEYKFAKINKSNSIKGEADLTIQLVSKLYNLLEFTTIIEDYVVYEDQKERVFRPSTSLFYWGKAQLERFQEMLDRNFDYLVKNKTTKTTYQKVMLYFSPTEKEVAHPYQHKKLFDVQKFAETCVGVPTIINYTWHDIATKLFSSEFSKKYWIPHFDFLDLNIWLEYLSLEVNDKEKQEKEAGITKQHLYKLRTIDQIRYTFQTKGYGAISQNSRPKSTADFKSAILPSTYHSIAHVWYLFSLRTHALQLQESEFYRTIYPDFSIAKMKAAKVSDLSQVNNSEEEIFYKFTLRGLSSHMNLKNGDVVLLIPLAKRDLNIGYEMYDWRITINDVVWDSNINGSRVTTVPGKTDVFQKCKNNGIIPRDDWYLFPLTFDPWSRKLYNSVNANTPGLLQLNSFGTSWLGKRLSYLWNIGSEAHDAIYMENEFTLPCVYLFAPKLFVELKTIKQITNLTTNIHPPPDISQKKAILNSLNNIISAILGPPGTGKSQTVAALIDEYLCQRKTQKKTRTRILVTSFSYAALNVVIEKVRGKSRDVNGKPTLSSQAQIIFIRSERQLSILPKKGCRNVDDLFRNRNGTWVYNGQTRIVTPKKPLEEQLDDNCIVFANAHQLYRLQERVAPGFAFDLICVDEASQMPVDQILASLHFIHQPNITVQTGKNYNIDELSLKDDISVNNLTKLVIVGDNNQLPPVRSMSLPKNLEPVLKSLFSYYVEGHSVSSRQLEVNYRSHKDIVEFTSTLGFYKNLRPSDSNAKKTLAGDLTKVDQFWSKIVLSPERVVSSIQHDTEFEVGISMVEAEIVAQLVSDYYKMVEPINEDEEKTFWSRKVGVVSPHNAQGRAIIQKIFGVVSPFTKLDKSLLMDYLRNSVYSVEKFQGSDRNLIITSIGLSDVDKIGEECEFIFDINRFNVLTSRAKNKLIFVSSKEFLRYVPEDRLVIENAAKINYYVKKFCNKKMKLPIIDGEGNKTFIKFRFKK